jgi:hypothetical protein
MLKTAAAHVLDAAHPSIHPPADVVAGHGDGAPPHNAYLLRCGLSLEVARAAVNEFGFSDPFDPSNRAHATLDNPAYRILGRSLMIGKLDWALLAGATPVTWAAGNDDYAASDHRWLAVDVALSPLRRPG